MTEPGNAANILDDPAWSLLRRRAAAIRWAATLIALFAYGSYSWLTGYAGDWFSQPVSEGAYISTGLIWIAGSIILLILSEILYEWYCRRKLDPLRAELAGRYSGREDPR